jgi:hypothetical protein
MAFSVELSTAANMFASSGRVKKILWKHRYLLQFRQQKKAKNWTAENARRTASGGVAFKPGLVRLKYGGLTRQHGLIRFPGIRPLVLEAIQYALGVVLRETFFDGLLNPTASGQRQAQTSRSAR